MKVASWQRNDEPVNAVSSNYRECVKTANKSINYLTFIGASECICKKSIMARAGEVSQTRGIPSADARDPIIINLVISGACLDVALRDFGLALGAFALAKLGERIEPVPRA